MKKRLSLKSERLVELTPDELRQAAAGAPDYTGNPLCSMSFVDPCVSNYCIGRALTTIIK